MNILIVIGSSRQNSQSEKVARYLAQEIKTKHPTCSTQLFWTKDIPVLHWEGAPQIDALPPNHAVFPLLEKADSLIIISPEWSGMVPPSLKNFFLAVGQKIAHKPGLIVSVSSARAGTYPIAELRMSSYKNTKICYIPDHLIISQVESVLNESQPVSKKDTYIRSRIDYSLEVLCAYTAAFKGLRDHIDLTQHGYGM